MTSSVAPDGAWHYTNAEGLLGIVTSDILWASSGAFMNDEQELIKGQTLIRGELVDSSRFTTQERAVLQELDALIENPRRQDFILSATELSDSLTLWRNYGREDVSYAICLDKTVQLVPLAKKHYVGTDKFPYADDSYYEAYMESVELKDGESESFLVDDPDNHVFRHNSNWEKVLYAPREQNKLIQRVIRDYLATQKTGTTASLDTLLGLDKIRIQRELSLIKDQGFADESEIRRHYSLVQPRWKFVHYRSSELGLTPYICLTTKHSEGSFAGEFGAIHEFETETQKLPILAIRIGPCRYPDIAELALRDLLDEHGYANTLIYRSEVPFR